MQITTLKVFMTRTDTLSASERDYQAFPRTHRITVRASGGWTAARHLIGYPLTNRIFPHAACSANALFTHYKLESFSRRNKYRSHWGIYNRLLLFKLDVFPFNLPFFRVEGGGTMKSETTCDIGRIIEGSPTGDSGGNTRPISRSV